MARVGWAGGTCHRNRKAPQTERGKGRGEKGIIYLRVRFRPAVRPFMARPGFLPMPVETDRIWIPFEDASVELG